jgi:hypothetical protein
MKCAACLFLALAAGFALPSFVDARIGESRESLERRLFASGGIIYRDKEERSSRRQSGPYSGYMQYLGSSAEVRVYFKSDDGSQPAQTDIGKGDLRSGWELHVLYVAGKSVFEQYKRIGNMTEQESNALLALLGDGGYWAEPEAPAEGEEPPPSAFGFDYVRNDGAVRAKKGGGGLMVFQKQLDEFLARQQESDRNQKAPLSVRGF